MSIAIKELIRRPGRFVSVGGALTMLVVLLVVLGGFLDGLELNRPVPTGPTRADCSSSPRRASCSSRGRKWTRVKLSSWPPPTVWRRVGALNQIESTAGDSQGEIVDIVLFGYDLPTDVIPSPPVDGGAIVDEALADRNDVAVGDTLLLGADIGAGRGVGDRR